MSITFNEMIAAAKETEAEEIAASAWNIDGARAAWHAFNDAADLWSQANRPDCARRCRAEAIGYNGVHGKMIREQSI